MFLDNSDYFLQIFIVQTYAEVKKTREEVKEVRGLESSTTSTTITSLPYNFSVQFPLGTHEDIERLETYLNSSSNQNLLIRKHYLYNE